MKKLLLTGSCLVLLLLANNAKAGIDTWDPQGASGNATGGTWENASWDTANQTGTGSLANFVEGDAVNFAFGDLGGSASTFTVTMNANHTVAGWFNGPLTPKSCYLTISGTGSINVAGGIQGFDTAGSTLGHTTLAVPITSTLGGLPVLEGGGQIFLNATNTYSAGTDLGYSANGFTGIANFNNNASFGTGTIWVSNCSSAALAVEGTSAITIANKIVVNGEVPNVSLNIVGNPAGVTFSGTWSLGTNTPQIGSGGGASDLIAISGVISGTGGFWAWNTGILEFNNAMTYSGPTMVSNTVSLTLGPSGSITGTGLVTVQTNATLADTNTSGSRAIAGAVTFQAAGAGGAAAKAIFNGSGSSVGSISMGGNLTLNATPITIHVSGSALAAGTYRLLSCSGTVAGSAATTATITGVALPVGYVAAVTTTTGAGGHVDLNVVQPPTVSIAPAVVTVASGEQHVIIAAATGTQLSYQWQFNGGSLISGQVVGNGGASLTINPALDADAGTYTVTVSNPANSAQASQYLVVVDPASYSAGQFSMNYTGPAGLPYRIWCTTNLELPVYQWNLIDSGDSFSGGLDTYTDSTTNAANSDGFYSITIP